MSSIRMYLRIPHYPRDGLSRIVQQRNWAQGMEASIGRRRRPVDTKGTAINRNPRRAPRT